MKRIIRDSEEINMDVAQYFMFTFVFAGHKPKLQNKK